jgi:hypothetical protein
VLLAALLADPSEATENDHQFNFANVGMSYSAAIFASDPIVGRRVISTTLVLNLSVDPGSDAADFTTDILLPIQTDAPTGSVVLYSGLDLGWAGSGVFQFTETTTRYNGVIVPARFGAETFGVQGFLLAGSGIVVTFEPLCVADVDDGSGAGTPDGAVTINDLLYFLAAFEVGDLAADVDDGSGTGVQDSAVTIDDLLYFLVRFEAGC